MKPKGSKNPVGAITPSSFSKAARDVVALPTWAGAKAAAPAIKEATITDFMVLIDEGCLVMELVGRPVGR